MVLSDYRIAELAVAGGYVGIAPIPGRLGAYAADLNVILRWGANMVLTMTPMAELQHAGAETLGEDLAAASVDWRHIPIGDFGVPEDKLTHRWDTASQKALEILGQGGRVFTHCYGGCGRAGMAALRLMVEAGEAAEPALVRLRQTRPCAVQTEAQFAWAASPGPTKPGWQA